jgi:NADPH-dependent 2,4-dienoyl-CoA reductase/sulfur reductase-like enzyme
LAKRFVVVGGDAAGMSAASLVKRRAPEWEIEAYEMGDFTSYGACGMPYYVSGDVKQLDDLVVVTPEAFREKRGINVFMRHRVETILPDKKRVEVLDLETGKTKEAPYDELLISTGAEPIVPQGVDLDMEGVFTLRTLHDAGGIKDYAAQAGCKDGLVVGTGYIGMEMAEALKSAGLKVSILGRSPRLMGAYEDEISQAVAEELDRQDIEVTFGPGLSKMEKLPDGRIQAVRENGESVNADIVVMGLGVRPRSELAGSAGLTLGVQNAISVDRRQKTSHDHIWSAGDCAEAYHAILKKNAYIPLALTANRAGRIAGGNIAGENVEFPGIFGSAVCKICDLTAARTGLGLDEARNAGFDAEKVVVQSNSRAHYYPGGGKINSVLIVEKGTRRVLGAQMAGTDGVAHRINIWAAAIGAGMTLPQVHALDLAYAPPFSPVWDPILIASEVAMKKVK